MTQQDLKLLIIYISISFYNKNQPPCIIFFCKRKGGFLKRKRDFLVYFNEFIASKGVLQFPLHLFRCFLHYFFGILFGYFVSLFFHNEHERSKVIFPAAVGANDKTSMMRAVTLIGNCKLR